jgi:tRNA (guanine-N7-)-methyltransferase
VIEIKTDQPSLYTYTLAQIKLFKNLRLIYQTENLYQDQNALINNIPTEYETKFVQQGKPIYQIKLQKLN